MCIRDSLLTKVDFPTLGLPIIAIDGRVNYSPKKIRYITTIPSILSFTLNKSIYLISGSPKWPFDGLGDGEDILGNLEKSSKEELESIAQ